MAGLREHHGGGGGHGSSSSSSSSPYLDYEPCPICFKSPSKVRMEARADGSPYAPSTLGCVVICDCGHGFCESCVTQYVRIAICEGGTRLGTLRCPMDGCKVPMQDSLLEILAVPEDWEKHCRFVEELKLVQDRLLRLCPRPDCNGHARLVRQANDNGIYADVACRTCRHDFCANCGLGPHQGKGVKEAGDKDYIKWRNENDVKPCPGCGHDVEKISSCPVMGCTSCATFWCWDCGCKCRRCKHGAITRHAYFLLTPINYAEYHIRRLRWMPEWLQSLLLYFLLFVMMVMMVEAVIPAILLVFFFWDAFCYGLAQGWIVLLYRWIILLEAFVLSRCFCICFFFMVVGPWAAERVRYAFAKEVRPISNNEEACSLATDNGGGAQAPGRRTATSQ